MTHAAIMKRAVRFDDVVQELYPAVVHWIRPGSRRKWAEADLRRELVSCILGSQVRYEMACRAMAGLEEAGLLEDRWWRRDKVGYESAVYAVLRGSGNSKSPGVGYRFPALRARQLAGAREALAKVPLTERLLPVGDIRKLRRDLVHAIPGLGPKQASMFLRNTGYSQDLAILDTHVIRFLDAIEDQLPPEVRRLGSLNAYESIEEILAAYADRLGYKVGYLDQAIWITMRAAWELGI